jgi:hypothetical protein
MDEHLAGRDWFVGEAVSLADIALYAYTHVCEDGGFRSATTRRSAPGWRGSDGAGLRADGGLSPSYSDGSHVAVFHAQRDGADQDDGRRADPDGDPAERRDALTCGPSGSCP